MNFLEQIEQYRDEIRRILGVPTHAELAFQLKGITSTVDRQLAEIAAEKPGDLTNGMFGAGKDGALVFDGTSTVLGLVPSASTYTLNRSIFAASIIVNHGVTVLTRGYRMFVLGTLTNFGTVSNAGNNGLNAGNQSGVVGGAALVAVEVGGSSTGGPSGSGTIGAGSNGTSGSSLTNAAGGAGATGGNGGNIPAGSGGGTGGAGGALTVRAFHGLSPHLILGASLLSGGSGGGGGAGGAGSGGSNFGGAGGSGGSGGGVLLLFAHTIQSFGRITAAGGNGGNGANGQLGNSGGGGGGAGGGGGVLYLVYTKYDGTGLVTASGGLGGAPGNGLGTGNPGLPGNPGTDGKLFRYNTTTGLWDTQ